MTTSVVCLAPELATAERMVAALRDAGVDPDDIAVAVTPPRAPRYEVERRTKVPEGAALGAGVGGAIGGAVGVILGRAPAIGWFGSLLVGGPLVDALAVAAIGATLGAGLGAAIGVFFPEYEALPAFDALAAPGVMVSVECGTAGEVEHARSVFERFENRGITVTDSDDAKTPVSGAAKG